MIKLISDTSVNKAYNHLLHSLVVEASWSKGEPTRQSNVRVYRNDNPDYQRMIVEPGTFPFCLDRKINLSIAWEEMLFFLNGKTQTKELEERGIYFWKGNTTREFLDERGLHNLEEGDMGKAYGYQWRHPKNDQLINLLRMIEESVETGSNNRRMIVNLWNPSELDEMALPPCWYSLQVLIQSGSIHFILNNRSLDVVFGFWYAVSQYRMLQMALASIFNLKVGYMDIRMADQHLYSSQIDWATELVKRETPALSSQNQNTISIPINKGYVLSPLDKLLSTKYEDFKIDYRFYNGIPMKTPRPPMEA